MAARLCLVLIVAEIVFGQDLSDVPGSNDMKTSGDKGLEQSYLPPVGISLPENSFSPPSPTPPTPPSPYTVPDGAVAVSTTEELVDHLSSSDPIDIVLEDGQYRNVTDTFISFSTPHRLWSRNLGGAVLRVGLVFGANEGHGGAEIHGITFNVSDWHLGGPQFCEWFQRAAIGTWGSGTQLVVEDCFLYGNSLMGGGIMAYANTGMRISRLIIRDFISYGIYTHQDENVEGQPVTLEDLDVAGISRDKPCSSYGTAEAGVWLGNTGTVQRIKIRDGSWMGLWTGGSCDFSTFRDFDIDGISRGDYCRGTAVYIEHTTRNSTFERFKIGNECKQGFNSEWGQEGHGAGWYNVIQEGSIDAWRVGVYFDARTIGSVVRNVHVSSASWAGIGMYNSDTCWEEDNDFDLPDGSPTFTTSHWNSH